MAPGDIKHSSLFPYHIGKKPGFIIQWILYFLCKGAQPNPDIRDRIRLMQSKGVVVYALKYRGILDFMLIHFNFHIRRIPYPRIAWDTDLSIVLPILTFFRITFSRLNYLIKNRRLPDPYELGYYRDAIIKRIPSTIFLVDPKGFLQRFFYSRKSPIQHLVELQRKIDHPIYIVPQVVLYRKKPEKEKSGIWNALFGYSDRVGLFKKLILFLANPKDIYIDSGSPINLKECIENTPQKIKNEEIAEDIKNRIIKGIDERKRIVIGPVMKSRQQIMEKVLINREFMERLEKMSGGDPKRLKQLKKKAREFFKEIAADYNITYIQIFDILLEWLFKRLFDDIEVNLKDISLIRERANEGPLIYVPSHKSHMDYLILNHTLYKNHMHIPRIAAGQNLTFWPMGPIFRRLGAFFIRRSFRFRGAKLYSEVFTRYIKTLLEDGHPIEFFIEGGRSRNGKLVLPKTGFLSILIQAFEEGYCNDLIFVPTSIVYDRIMEEKAYIKEIEGEEKKKESFFEMIKARSLLKRRYGKAYIRFNTPISLKEYLGVNKDRSREPSRELAFHLVNAINEVTIVTPLNLTATAILTNHRKGFYQDWLTHTVKLLHDFLRYKRTPFTDSFKEISSAIEDTMNLLIKWKVVERIDQDDTDEEPFFFVDDNKKLELDYYKNCIIHYFVPQSILALSLLRPRNKKLYINSILDNYLFLKNILRNEFLFEDKNSSIDEIKDSIRYFLFRNYIIEDNGHYILTKEGADILPLWGKILKNYLESYWLVAHVLSVEKNLEKKRVLQKIKNTARRFYKMGIIEHIESLSTLNFQNALDIFKRGKTESDESLSQLSKTLYEFIVPGHQNSEVPILSLPPPK